MSPSSSPPQFVPSSHPVAFPVPRSVSLPVSLTGGPSGGDHSEGHGCGREQQQECEPQLHCHNALPTGRPGSVVPQGDGRVGGGLQDGRLQVQEHCKRRPAVYFYFLWGVGVSSHATVLFYFLVNNLTI